MPLGRLVPLGRFGASWNIPLTVGDILYTPAGRIMRDERSLVALLLGTYCTPLLRDFLGDESLNNILKFQPGPTWATEVMPLFPIFRR